MYTKQYLQKTLQKRTLFIILFAICEVILLISAVLILVFNYEINSVIALILLSIILTLFGWFILYFVYRIVRFRFIINHLELVINSDSSFVDGEVLLIDEDITLSRYILVDEIVLSDKKVLYINKNFFENKIIKGVKYHFEVKSNFIVEMEKIDG
ncbi:MAG: hypothetical protein RBR80_03765 [Bacilli bacterium]|jgi:cytochrome c biogenesis protein CcdA|nr:hypothetical protein [Bacilli bacterium]